MHARTNARTHGRTDARTYVHMHGRVLVASGWCKVHGMWIGAEVTFDGFVAHHGAVELLE